MIVWMDTWGGGSRVLVVLGRGEGVGEVRKGVVDWEER